MVVSPLKKTLIIGLGATGLSVARHLAALGLPFQVADTRVAPPGLARLREIAPKAKVHLGALNPELISQMSRVVLSPGVSLLDPALRQALASGLEVIGDIELFAREANAPVAAITGSNGKSTVTTLLTAMARDAGRLVRAGGNLGTPALDLIETPGPDLYALELSSFQLETAQSLRPAAAAVLNVSADHMDRYTGLHDYAAAKARVYERAQVCVVNRGDAAVMSMVRDNCVTVSFGLDAPPAENSAAENYGLRVADGRAWLFRGATRLLAEDELRINGRHNTSNALAALALGDALGFAHEAMCHTLKFFTGLPHRMQWVAQSHGVTWYNDSKGTNVGATVAGLGGLPGPVVLIAGGDGKGANFAPLRPAVKTRVRALILLGRDAGRIADALAGAAPVMMVDDMEAAVAHAATLARPGDQILLSPACASFDMYGSYTERGEHFMSAVRRLFP
ncbi:MAG: UDP-N-acetylmuramoyl-L-alanine--D-glutamate ligase [Gammaproteobacteria bacterium]|nr:UDP-N-acetylmuramoyl-L-alanine--D-glutamate ligase [Gammaproteobacteria bacterium]